MSCGSETSTRTTTHKGGSLGLRESQEAIFHNETSTTNRAHHQNP